MPYLYIFFILFANIKNIFKLENVKKDFNFFFKYNIFDTRSPDFDVEATKQEFLTKVKTFVKKLGNSDKFSKIYENKNKNFTEYINFLDNLYFTGVNYFNYFNYFNKTLNNSRLFIENINFKNERE